MLLALAGVCIAGLTIGRAAAVAWLATVFASGIAAIEIVGIVRGWQPLLDAGSWPGLAALAVFGLVGATAIAGAYAAAPRPARGRIQVGVRALVAAGLIGLAISAAWTLLTAAAPAPADGPVDLWPVRATSRIALALIVGFGIVGALRDLDGPVSRARTRLAASGVPSGGAAPCATRPSRTAGQRRSPRPGSMPGRVPTGRGSCTSSPSTGRTLG
jgi:hypothetical protein